MPEQSAGVHPEVVRSGSVGGESRPATPLRSHGERTADGWIRLSSPDLGYRDGGEERVREILRSVTDLSSDSDEALRQASTWAERYHLSPARANVLRPLDLPPDARVLEIGSGCGAITRYLGEQCAVVDAVEPMPARASAAVARTGDLDSVQVFVGMPADIPREPAYDVVIVVGVLEYVGSGSADPAPYAEFLQQMCDVLVDGGSLVLAIENKLGAKYFAGAPEDHSDRVFDSLEGYPGQSPARTFSRRELTAMVEGAGFASVSSRVAFPDYKMTRVVLAPEVLPSDAESLLYRLPHFPSPDWVTQRQHLFSEGLLWRSLVGAGLASDTGNSLLLLAGKGGPSALWPADRVGEYYSIERRPGYSVRTRVEVDGGQVHLRRRLARPTPADAPFTLRVTDGVFHPSTDFVDVFVDTDDERSRRLLDQWVQLLEKARGSSPFPIDLVPHNLVIGSEGMAKIIDQEWWSPTADVTDVLRRGALQLAMQLYHRRPNRAPWRGCVTFADAARSIGDAVGLTGDWLGQAVDAEARLQEAVISASGESDPERVVEGIRNALLDMLDTELRSPADFVPHAEERRVRQVIEEAAAREHALHGELKRLTDEVIAVHEDLRITREGHLASHGALEAARLELERLTTVTDERDAARDEAAARQEEIDRLRRSISWRVTRPLRLIRRLPVVRRR